MRKAREDSYRTVVSDDFGVSFGGKLASLGLSLSHFLSSVPQNADFQPCFNRGLLRSAGSALFSGRSGRFTRGGRFKGSWKPRNTVIL